MRSGGSSSGKVAIFGATTLLDFVSLERFDLTTVESSLCWDCPLAEDDPPAGVPVTVPRLLGFTFLARRRCNEFSGGRTENVHHRLRHFQIPLHARVGP